MLLATPIKNSLEENNDNKIQKVNEILLLEDFTIRPDFNKRELLLRDKAIIDLCYNKFKSIVITKLINNITELKNNHEIKPERRKQLIPIYEKKTLKDLIDQFINEIKRKAELKSFRNIY